MRALPMLIATGGAQAGPGNDRFHACAVVDPECAYSLRTEVRGVSGCRPFYLTPSG